MWRIPRLSDFFSDLSFNSTVDNDVFEQEYTCYPVSFLGREELENGNKILLPQSALNILARMNVSWPMLFKIANLALSRETHGGVLEFSAGEGTCYLPYWMMKNLLLQEGDLIRVTNTSLPKGTYVKLRPVTEDFLKISDHRAVLEYALRHFAALTVGDNILLKHNDRFYEIEIVDCLPAPAISIIETDVQVDFAPPKDYVDQTKRKSNDAINEKMSADINSSEKTSNLTNFIIPEENPDKNSAANVFERIPGGVRVFSSEYEELLKSGKIVGKTTDSYHRQNAYQATSSNFVLFGGEGNKI